VNRDLPVFECLLKRYHRTVAIARVRTVMPNTIPPIIAPRFVLERDEPKKREGRERRERYTHLEASPIWVVSD